MLHVKYKLDRSGKHGIGLFAGEDLKKGQLVYTASPILDVDITEDKFEMLAEAEKSEVKYWGFFDKVSQKWHVDFDVSKFINHSVDATVSQDPNHREAYLIAKRDLLQGEELTQNYLEFESKQDLLARGIVV